jgi:hypothetical protein
MYEILKDFAGPVATVIVAAFVGWITWSHNTTQTALTRYNLRINLFENTDDKHEKLLLVFSARARPHVIKLRADCRLVAMVMVAGTSRLAQYWATETTETRLAAWRS